MEVSGVIVDPTHIFNCKCIFKKEFAKMPRLQIAKLQNNDKIYYLIKKDQNYDLRTKFSFIKHMERSFELIHPSILNLSGFSTKKPILYFKYIQNAKNINDIELSDDKIQKIFLGIASGLSYLLYKGFYFSNFSIDSVIYDENGHPKIIDYIELNQSNNENDLVKKYVEVINKIIYMKLEQDSTISLNEDLKSLINRCKTNDCPSLDDFIKFFELSCYRANSEINISKYSKFLQTSDKIPFDDSLKNEVDSVENVCLNFFQFRNYKFDLDCNDFFMLNKLPEYYIKPMVNFLPVLFDKLIKFSYNEDVSLILPNWQKLSFSNSFEVYKTLMNKLKYLVKQKNQIIYFTDKRKEIEYKIDSIRIQAIYFLKKSFKESNDSKVKNELAIQYIKNLILPINLNKALEILRSIPKEENNKIDDMIKKLKSTINSSSFQFLSKKVPKEHIEKLKKAQKGDIFSLLFVGFSFYTGFNGFPISFPLSIHCYREASKKSPDAMMLLGYLYLNGIFFPQNLKRARNCFKRAADKGSIKAQIIDSFIRKHMWRNYLVNFDINDIFNNYLPSFKSMSDPLFFPKMNYNIENGYSDTHSLELLQNEDNLRSNHTQKRCSMFFDFTYNDQEKNKLAFSEKIFLSTEIFENTNDVNKQMFIAKSYFYGENGFPVNYTKASIFFKLAADNGNSEAQWRYALLCIYQIGSKNNSDEIEKYFQKSIKQNDMLGKFYYALYIKNNGGDSILFEQLLKQCCESGNLNAMYYYAMHLESVDLSLETSIKYYKKAADQGHFDSFIRLINIFKTTQQTEYFEEYLNLSIGILNETLFTKMIHLFDKTQNYNQSNILIRYGIIMNYKLFNFYYIDHLLYGKGMEKNIERAKKISALAFKDKYPKKYQDKYIYSMLQAFALNNENINSIDFLYNYRKRLDIKYKKYFHLFYRYFDKNLAQFLYITACFCCQEYISIYDILFDFRFKDINLFNTLAKLISIAKRDKNPYAYAILGKLIKSRLIIIRDLKMAIKYFALSAEKNCPLGLYYLGKEYFYGRYLDQNFDKAKELLLKAIENDDEPRAGYYLFKISGIQNDENLNAIEFLKTGAIYNHKRALYKYGQLLYTGKDKRIQKDEANGIDLLKKASQQLYKKALRFCKVHGIDNTNEDIDEKSINDTTEEEEEEKESSFDFICRRIKRKTNLNSSENIDDVDNDSLNYSKENDESSEIKTENMNSDASISTDDVSLLNKFWS